MQTEYNWNVGTRNRHPFYKYCCMSKKYSYLNDRGKDIDRS